MNWINVEETLPDKNNCYVLVACDGGNVTTTFYSTNRECLKAEGNGYSRKRQGKASGFFALSHKYGYKITHWMYLPEAPQ